MTWNYGTVSDHYEAAEEATDGEYGETDVEVCWYNQLEDQYAVLVEDSPNDYRLFVQGYGQVKRIKVTSRDNAEGLARSTLESDY